MLWASVDESHTVRRKSKMAGNKKKTPSTKNKKSPYQKTREKLSNTPFNTVKELEAVDHEIGLENWKRLAIYRNFQKQLQGQENASLREDFEVGILCGFATNKDIKINGGDASILRVYKASAGIQVKINENKPADPDLVASLAANMAHSFGSLFYEITGLKKISAPTKLSS